MISAVQLSALNNPSKENLAESGKINGGVQRRNLLSEIFAWNLACSIGMASSDEDETAKSSIQGPFYRDFGSYVSR